MIFKALKQEVPEYITDMFIDMWAKMRHIYPVKSIFIIHEESEIILCRTLLQGFKA